MLMRQPHNWAEDVWENPGRENISRKKKIKRRIGTELEEGDETVPHKMKDTSGVKRTPQKALSKGAHSLPVKSGSKSSVAGAKIPANKICRKCNIVYKTVEDRKMDSWWIGCKVRKCPF